MVLVTKSKKEPALHHKKRSGGHHKHTKPYARAYWPYLPLLVIVGFGLVLNSFWGHLSNGQVLGDTTDVSAATLLNDSNDARTKSNESKLALNPQLMQAATDKAHDMANRNYWSHTTPDGQQPWSFMAANGYDYSLAGENLAYGFAGSEDVVRAWLNSPEHRANLLNVSFTDVGFGIVHAAHYQGSKPQTIVVAMYGTPVSASSSQNVTASTPETTRQLTRLELFAGNAIPGSLWILISVSVLAFGFFLLRHARFAHRALVYSEAYIVRHRHIDTVLIIVAVAGILLSRGAGFIH